MQMDIVRPIVDPSVPRFGPVNTLSRSVPAWHVMKATILKNLRINRRYIPNLVGGVVQLIIRLLFFLLLANVITMGGMESSGMVLTGKNLFIFFQGAILLFIFKGTALWTPLNTISNDLYNGTLEYLYSNPASRYAYYLGTVLSDILISQIAFLPLYIFLVITANASLQNMLMVLAVCAAVFVVLIAMGVMVGLLGLIWRQVNSLAGIVEISLEMITGAYFPLTALPQGVQYIAYCLPFTWGYDLIRYYSFDGQWQTALPVWQEWTILLLFAVVYTALSRYLLVRVERYAKKNGLHLL